MTARAPLTYKASGVDIDAGEALVERIRPAVNRTWRPEVIGGLGGFGGLFRVPVDRFRRPILVCGADGVGTKLKLAIVHDAHDEIGIDLVAMCVNDVIVAGGRTAVLPRLFRDPAAGRGHRGAGDRRHRARLRDGRAATLLGGETAEHPGMHVEGEYDLAGFCVGVVEEDRLLDGQTIAAGDAVSGLAAFGPALERVLVDPAGAGEQSGRRFPAPRWTTAHRAAARSHPNLFPGGAEAAGNHRHQGPVPHHRRAD